MITLSSAWGLPLANTCQITAGEHRDYLHHFIDSAPLPTACLSQHAYQHAIRPLPTRSKHGLVSALTLARCDAGAITPALIDAHHDATARIAVELVDLPFV